MKKILNIFILTLAIFPVFILPVFGINYLTYGIFSALLLGLTILTGRFSKELFSTILFFTLIHVSRPVNDWFTQAINLRFPGTFFLVPLVLFTVFIITVPSIKKGISWWKLDKLDKNSLKIIVGLSIVSGLALIVWGNTHLTSMHKFKEIFPQVSFAWAILNGIGFAVFNSLAEEYLSRGMLCNGLEKIFSNKPTIILIQSIVFAIFHYHGFPGGLIGMIMVFSWSVALGIIRYRTRGLLGVLIGHFFADLTIYFILFLQGTRAQY